MRCRKCGRNYTKPLMNGKCGVCAKMDYKYSQGAVLSKTYKAWEMEWIPKRHRSFKV